MNYKKSFLFSLLYAFYRLFIIVLLSSAIFTEILFKLIVLIQPSCTTLLFKNFHYHKNKVLYLYLSLTSKT